MAKLKKKDKNKVNPGLQPIQRRYVQDDNDLDGGRYDTDNPYKKR